jgi:enamine deaminase RidA (YjgF/YER057c/UK114 family)
VFGSLDCSAFGTLRDAGPIAFSDLLWVIHTSEEARQFATHRVHIDAYDLPLRTQTVLLYRQAERLLSERGLTPAHVIHQRVHLRDLADVGRWAQMFRSEFPGWDPATVLFGEGDGLPLGAEIALELVVATDSARLPRRVWVDEIGAATDPFPGAVEYAGLVFTSGVNPVHPKTGEVVRNCADLTGWSSYTTIPEFRVSGAYGRRDEHYAAQMLAIYAHLDKILRAVGSDLTRLVKTNGYSRVHMKAFSSWEAARPVVYVNPSREVPPATSMQVADVGCSRDVDIVFECIGISDPKIEREIVDISRQMSQRFGLYTPVVKAGSLVFTSGELAVSAAFPGVAGAWENDVGRSLAAQTPVVVNRVAAMLGAGGVQPADVVRLGVYPRSRSYMETWCRIARSCLPDANPAIVATTALNVGPYNSCLFELDGVGVVKA